MKYHAINNETIKKIAHNINDMFSNNLIYVIMFFITIGIIVYIYLDRSSVNNFEPIKKRTKSCIKKKDKKRRSKKKVRFDDNVKYHYYDTPIDMDKVLYGSRTELHQYRQKAEQLSELSEHDSEETQLKPVLSDSDHQNHFAVPDFNINASNLEMPDNAWDASFGVPLVNKDERKVHFDRVQKSNKKYEQNMGDFVEYQTDRSSVVEPEFKIDPFKPTKVSNELTSKKIREIYDEQVQTPKAKPKKIRNKSLGVTYYENETENNGGMIRGTHLHGSKGSRHTETYGSAAFGNEF